MILSINTTNLDNIQFKLLDGKKVIAEYSIALAYQQNGDILKHLEKFLRQHGADSSGTRKSSKLRSQVSRLISAISVSAGAGSYSGIRVGTSIAQALSLAWNIPLKVLKK